MIEEVPIVDDSKVEVTEPEVADIAEVAEPEVVKRGRGRPPGAKGKAKPAKPEKPVKAVPKPEPDVESPIATPEPAPAKQKRKKAAPKKRPIQSSDSEEEAPGRRRLAEPDTQSIALEVMQLLSDQHTHRATARRNKYAGWFSN